MTTKQEFQTAIKMLVNCKATINCGCQYDREKADWLYYQCKSYIEAYKKMVNKDPDFNEVLPY